MYCNTTTKTKRFIHHNYRLCHNKESMSNYNKKKKRDAFI